MLVKDESPLPVVIKEAQEGFEDDTFETQSDENHAMITQK